MLRAVPPVRVIIFLSVFLWGGEYLRRGLWEPDEARYAYVAQEMRSGGHWLVPHINGEPYPDKPPLLFWLINASSLFTCGEINGVSARLPSLLGAILSLWAVTRLMVRRRSPEAAWCSMMVLMTSYLFWHEGGWGRIDALLCGLVMMSVYFLFRSSEVDRGRAKYEVLGYIFAGLAVLAKGPVGLAVPMGIYAFGSLAAGERQQLRRYHWLWGPFLATAIPGLWLLAAWFQHPPNSYFAEMFGVKSFGRVVAGNAHSQPIYYLVLHFITEFLPWTLFLPAALRVFSDKILKRRLLGGFAFVIVMFSLFVCKRNVYILAAYPMAAMLIGAAWDEMENLSRRWAVGTAVAGIILIFGSSIAVTVGVFILKIPFSSMLLIPSATVLAVGGWGLARLFRYEGLSHRWLLSYGLTIMLFHVTVGAIVMPALNSTKSPVEAAAAVRERLEPGQTIYLYGQQLAIFPLYAGRPGREIHTYDELMRVTSQETNAIVVFREVPWKEHKEDLKDITTERTFQMGHKQLHWVEFRR